MVCQNETEDSNGEDDVMWPNKDEHEVMHGNNDE